MEEPLNFLIVDDEESIRSYLSRMLRPHSIDQASDGMEALSLIKNKKDYDALITDIKMPKLSGYELAQHVLEKSPDTVVTMMTGFPDVKMAVEIIKCGAFDYLTKPFEPEFLELKLQQIISVATLRREKRKLAETRSNESCFSGLIGKSAQMQQVFQLIRKASRKREINVLITGETGTGKEVVANAIHACSKDAGAFVPINCGALPRDLAESELFGYSKGAFTGATMNKPGLFEDAEDGTLFLDEVNSLPLDLQVKLNRAIEQREARRLGQTQSYRVNCRFLAATNQPLQELVNEGTFREDLIYRLKILEINLPPLRERKEDIPILIQHFLTLFGEGKIKITDEAISALLSYDWPGNIRELRHCIESACLLCDSDIVDTVDLPLSLIQKDPKDAIDEKYLQNLNYQQAVEVGKANILREYLPNLISSFHGNVTIAAQHADIQRETLHRLLKKYDIDPKNFR